ncbi:MAG: hypothetical protein DRN08_03355 [Thermoplasmata archaeon]|nr:MAG: hypothetical protein DRN05_04450 [Thermoplasmata archaeon]RLF35247.1 MAG: hypothetical protein DRN08_03355 [Thermoplasmata archaeon]
MHAVINHIPDKQFKTIRHYGVYSRGIKRKFKRLRSLVSIAQMKLTKFIESWAPICPNCGKKWNLYCLGWKNHPQSGVLVRELVTGITFPTRVSYQ